VVPHGALSFFLARELAVARPGTTYRDVFERASVAVSSRYRDQHPQMEGDARDREVLGTKVVEVMPFVSVAGRTDGSVTLQGGAAFGLAPGSEWDVYPEGTKEANRTLRLGRVRIDELRALSSRATLLEESAPGAVVPGCRAVEVVHAFGDQRLGIEVRGPAEAAATTKELEADVDASPYLRAASTEAADLRVYLLSPRTGSAEGDPVPQLGRIDRPSWAVVGRDGRLAMPVHPVDEPGASEIVRSNLERIARYRSAVALTNPDPGAILRGKVDLVLQARTPKGDWEDATPTASGGTVVFAEGDRIALRVTNGHTEPVYVSVLDFGLTGRIAQVYPPAGVADRVDPGMGIRVGVDPGAELPLEFPHDFPFVRDPDETAPVEGLETLKLFATTGRPVNFDPLLQEGMRADIGEPRSLRRCPVCCRRRSGDRGRATSRPSRWRRRPTSSGSRSTGRSCCAAHDGEDA
jgi:hypothetical protein